MQNENLKDLGDEKLTLSNWTDEKFELLKLWAKENFPPLETTERCSYLDEGEEYLPSISNRLDMETESDFGISYLFNSPFVFVRSQQWDYATIIPMMDRHLRLDIEDRKAHVVDCYNQLLNPELRSGFGDDWSGFDNSDEFIGRIFVSALQSFENAEGRREDVIGLWLRRKAIDEGRERS